MNSYESGNTVVLQGTCTTNDGSETKIEPDKIKLKIYDNVYNLLEDIPLTEENRVVPGVYAYKYTFPERGAFYYEFSGEINGYPYSSRKKIDIVFAKGVIY